MGLSENTGKNSDYAGLGLSDQMVENLMCTVLVTCPEEAEREGTDSGRQNEAKVSDWVAVTEMDIASMVEGTDSAKNVMVAERSNQSLMQKNYCSSDLPWTEKVGNYIPLFRTLEY